MARHQQDVRHFLIDVVHGLPISNSEVHASLGAFAEDSREVFDLGDHTSMRTLVNAISGFDLKGGTGEINEGLLYAVDRATTPAAGDRAGAKNVVVLITDDGTRNVAKLKHLEDELHSKANVIAIEIGHVAFNHLSSDARQSFHLRSTDGLQNIVDTVSTLICPKPVLYP